MKIIKADKLQKKPDFSKLTFGKLHTDYLLEMDYTNGAWGEPVIRPYSNFDMSPMTMCLHYGQGIFEGCKAFRNDKGEVTLFRIMDNFKRMNRSAYRMCMPQFDENVVLEALIEMLKIEKDWVPTLPGTALYLRPTMIATEVALGVHVSRDYKLFIVMSPVGAYLHGAEQTARIYIEDKYVRAAKGGTGEAKCLGNYAAGLLAQYESTQQGFDQVLWLDAEEHKYIEEVGTMNVMFVMDGVVCTPELDGSILRGITRHSIIKILRDEGYTVNEGRFAVDDIIKAAKEGRLTEMFGVGTAATVSPVGVIGYKGEEYIINNNKVGPVAKTAYDRLRGIQTRKYPDKYDWLTTID